MTKNSSAKKILLVYPRLGSGDAFIKDMPLSLVHAATHSVKAGIRVEILDLRLVEKRKWRDVLVAKMRDAFLVGLSVMTGTPIRNAMEITRFVKSMSDLPVVWGGPHCTVDPDRTIRESCIDYVIRGFGSEKLMLLANEFLKNSQDFSNICGLSYKKAGRIIHNEQKNEIELLPLEDIPYHLINFNDSSYSRFRSGEKAFPLFTSIGCPHKCAFCMSPVQYAHVKKRWVAYPVEEVLEHIEHIVEKYNPDCISIYDDDSFVDLPRMRSILEGILSRRISVRIDFRGARVDEVDRMDDSYLQLMEDVGVRHLQIGLESGSQRILDIIRKKTNVEQIIRMNRKLAGHEKLRPVYNIFCGVPGENIEDLKKTMAMVQTLIEENPNCLTGFLANYKPIPGSELYSKALELGLREPKTLAEWIDYDSSESEFYFPWYTKDYNDHIRFYQVVSHFIDNKVEKEMGNKGLKNKSIRFASKIYRPIAMWRLRNNIIKPLPEYYLMKKALKYLARNED